MGLESLFSSVLLSSPLRRAEGSAAPPPQWSEAVLNVGHRSSTLGIGSSEKTSAWSEEEGSDPLGVCWGPDATLSSLFLLLQGLAPPAMGPPKIEGGTGGSNGSETTGLCEFARSLLSMGLQIVPLFFFSQVSAWAYRSSFTDWEGVGET